MLTILGLLAFLEPTVPSVTPTHDIWPVQMKHDLSDRMWQILELDALMPILQEEAVTEAARIEGEGLIAGGGLSWARVVGSIHDATRMEALFRTGVRNAAARMNPHLVDQALTFHDSGLGRRVIRLEGSARRALLANGVEDQARADFDRALRDGEPRAGLILQLIDRADLIAPNVAGGLNAAIAFSRGYAEGGGFDMTPDSQHLMADAWAQRDQIEDEATKWLQGFLMLAYGPLSDSELSEYARHAASAEGRALSQMLFAGFDTVFSQTSYDMGMAAALREQGQQL